MCEKTPTENPPVHVLGITAACEKGRCEKGKPIGSSAASAWKVSADKCEKGWVTIVSKKESARLNLCQSPATGSLTIHTEASGTWEKITLTADSGASDTVVPEDVCSDVPTTPSPGSLTGMEYEVASGHKIPNRGQKQLQVVTERNQQRAITVQVCNVNKALLSVKKTCRTGHRVVFDDDGSYIENKATKERTPLKEEGGVYTLDVWVKKGQPFQRPER